MTDLHIATTLLPATVDKLTTTIFTALGEASGCWGNLNRAGVFDSDRCKGIGDDLLSAVVQLTGLGEPALGLATSAELMAELRARLDPGLAYVGLEGLKAVEDCLAGGLDYRTVGGS